MGGPNRNHYNHEDYIFTIAPDNVSLLSLSFSSFKLETGYDSLWIYDGYNTNAPLIGGYSGTASPGYVEASGNALTLKFYSDGATVRSGWTAEWNCKPVSVEKNNENNIEIYPNPATDFILLSETANKIMIYDIRGNLILSKQNTSEICIKNFSPGIYFIKIQVKNTVSVQKIIIQN